MSPVTGGAARRRLRYATVATMSAMALLLGGAALIVPWQAAGAQGQPAPRDSARRDTLPRPTRPDTVTLPSRPGEGRVTPGLDTLRADSPLRDGRRSAADSAARDSLVARQLREQQERLARGGDGGRNPAGRVGLLVDRLRLSSVGLLGGAAWPTRVEGTRLYGVEADYGEVLRGVRLVFQLSYWSSRYTRAARDGLAAQVGTVVRDPTNDARVELPEILASNLSFAIDGRWRPGALARRGAGSRVRPYLSGGLGVHLPNAQGAPISGTFVEQSLDGIALGVSGGAGVDVAFLPTFLLTMHARYDLFNGAHFPSLRAGLGYVLDPSSWRGQPRPEARR